ncbi:phage major tail tube protein [Ancylobacter polymorphus]|uniref:Phage tail tube protein FII n=1 Tax=Ancylobacter polymorphus TaxID=223390 RepID=A0ABU0B6A5_9HYPH|nr:phage major tail tube protein [Ancylobacter polymorphus]MDQ0301350.1 phage tail tube protein FII [Ancylobacter polymorphus]
MQSPYEMEAANLFVGEPDPQRALGLVLDTFKLPALQEKTRGHTGGGALAEIRMGTRVFEPFEFTFSLRGINPDVMDRVMSATGRLSYYLLGNVRNMITNEEIPGRAVIEGRMTKSDMGAFNAERGFSTDYQIDDVLHYSLHLNSQEKYWFQYQDGPLGWRVNGQIVFQTMARNIGLA